ncbi:MAG: ATP-dependent RecD-like DNA helicase [Deltaproteobacteria bacterium]|nr:ATP-dependent RecD-like DNA helicase [Deltaproteobacteria bacterium]MBW2049191.1 ATP-dependent RecD-like DNA helicase [Deltaproteobacteria bacterium]MBW2112666.1 ATP-dependent RecD-like DNA helicase [Deltaproteobacteria bacterium]HDZ90937.1 ATP-dependent RecD-like DNA helicase [Deltaproteobacteria bacterium]
MPEALEGQIERIAYSNEETGFTIARLKVYGRPDLVTVVGNLMAATPGEILKLKGEWTNHPRYGEQFKIVEYRTTVPASVYGIQKYLGSGLIKGIGPVMAKRIVEIFGEKTLDIIEEHPEELEKVPGIGKKRITMIQKAWEEQKEIRDVMLFLQGHGVGSGFATKIFKQYGNRSIQVVKESPYRLATDIFGIGFITADRIAANLGFDRNSGQRARAGVLYVLQQLADEGHVYYPHRPLLDKCREILGVEEETVINAVQALSVEGRLVIEDTATVSGETAGTKGVYLARFHVTETGIARHLKGLMQTPKSIRSFDADRAAAWVQTRLSIDLAPNQVLALKGAAENKVLVITGGPGTGKTTIINAVLKIFSGLRARVLLAAPTGRAAKRMSEATGYGARTIHRLLKYSLQKGGFQRNEQHPLNCDLIVVDEASMIDTVLMYHLLKAIPPEATFILVGDVNQLPSVGPGNVLADIIASDAVPVVRLNEIFRQARESRIIVNAHRINNGLLPSLSPSGPEDDFYFIEQGDPEKVLHTILELVKDRVPGRFGFDPVDDIQVLSPMHRGKVGTSSLNAELQRVLNPRKDGVTRGDRAFRIGDKVMQIRNNYDKEVFNGDVGRISRIDPEMREVEISFDGRRTTYDFMDLDEIVLAYAVSIHKSQGSEYPAVVVPILTQHYMLLQRNLIYTAVTRGRSLVIVIGTRKALAMGVKNAKTLQRYTLLEQRLRWTEA